MPVTRYMPAKSLGTDEINQCGSAAVYSTGIVARCTGTTEGPLPTRGLKNVLSRMPPEYILRTLLVHPTINSVNTPFNVQQGS